MQTATTYISKTIKKLFPIILLAKKNPVLGKYLVRYAKRKLHCDSISNFIYI